MLDEKGNFNVMTLEEAGKLAKKKSLNLIEVDTKAENIKSTKGRAVYKLMSQAEFYGDDFKSKNSAGDYFCFQILIIIIIAVKF